MTTAGALVGDGDGVGEGDGEGEGEGEGCETLSMDGKDRMPLAEAVISAVPEPIAFASPSRSIVATKASLDSQVKITSAS
jgi:hypothetical protein